MSDLFPIDIEGCRVRQNRLRKRLEAHELEVAVLTRPESVQWLTGAYVGPLFVMAAAIDQSGQVIVVVPEHLADEKLAADKIISYQAQRLATIQDEQWSLCIGGLLGSFQQQPSSAGGEFAYLSRYLTNRWDSKWTDIEGELLTLRRRKEPDELRMLARANKANEAMYNRARSVIEPGLAEIELYNDLQSVATRTLGEPLTSFGQDFQCNSIGGPPRARQSQQGELWILDLGVGFRGYRSDNCRTIAVGDGPDERQTAAHDVLCAVFEHVESTVRPGISCRELYEDARKQLNVLSPYSFPHHLGHGVGLAAHESPRLNPHWNDYFEVGDFFTVEPGLYSDQLRGGIRLEQNYVVTEDGVKLLTDWSLEL